MWGLPKWHAEKNSKQVDLADLSAVKNCWATVRWFCSSCGDDPAKKCTAAGSSGNDSNGEKVVVPGVTLSLSQSETYATMGRRLQTKKKLNIDSKLKKTGFTWILYLTTFLGVTITFGMSQHKNCRGEKLDLHFLFYFFWMVNLVQSFKVPCSNNFLFGITAFLYQNQNPMLRLGNLC